MSNFSSEVDARPAIVGRQTEVACTEEASERIPPSSESPDKPRRRSLVCIASSCHCIILAAILIGGYEASGGWCARFEFTRRQRFAWASPLYILAPGSAVALTSVYLFTSGTVLATTTSAKVAALSIALVAMTHAAVNATM